MNARMPSPLLTQYVRLSCLRWPISHRTGSGQNLRSHLACCSKSCNFFIQQHYIADSLSQGLSRHNSSSRGTPQRQHRVWVSRSQNIFSNLALEDWMYRKMDFETESILLLWRNNPCIVIGRHQNPWVECNVIGANADCVPVVRRNSGGGTVYHDLGNMCVSFFTTRALYERKQNLNLIKDAVIRRWPVNLQINDRDDILLDNKHKISGTAAKLGGNVSYHHCTLLVDVNKRHLHHYLTPKMVGLESKATESVRAVVKNLREAHPGIGFEELVHSISTTYLQQGAQQGNLKYVDPTCSATFPGIEELEKELRDWKWIYGKTPKFSVAQKFVKLNQPEPLEMHLKFDVDKGRLSCVAITGLPHSDDKGEFGSQVITQLLEGIPFEPNHIDKTFASLSDQILGTETARLVSWIRACFREIFS